MQNLKILIDREILKPMALINDNLDELVKMPGRLEQFGTKCRRKTNKYSRKLKSAHPLFPGFFGGDRTANLTASACPDTVHCSGRVVPVSYKAIQFVKKGREKICQIVVRQS